LKSKLQNCNKKEEEEDKEDKEDEEKEDEEDEKDEENEEDVEAEEEEEEEERTKKTKETKKKNYNTDVLISITFFRSGLMPLASTNNSFSDIMSPLSMNVKPFSRIRSSMSLLMFTLFKSAPLYLSNLSCTDASLLYIMMPKQTK
jgi:uncharacterized membrane protein YdbT with pleckstrin-like domain